MGVPEGVGHNVTAVRCSTCGSVPIGGWWWLAATTDATRSRCSPGLTHVPPRRPARLRRHEHANAGLHPRSKARPGPTRRQSRRGRPMDRAGGMENAHQTLAAECTGVEARFPHRLGRHKTPPTRSTGKIVVLFKHDVTGRTRAPVVTPMGGNSPRNVATLRRVFTFAEIRVDDPRIRRSTSPEWAACPQLQEWRRFRQRPPWPLGALSCSQTLGPAAPCHSASLKFSSSVTALGSGVIPGESCAISRATASCPITTRNHCSRSVITRYCRWSAVPAR